MSIHSSSNNGSSLVFHEFKKHASIFLRDKIKAARLALTDVTSIQLLVEEATKGNLEIPDSRTLKLISRAAFEVDDYWRIVGVLHQRLLRFDRRNWRISYNTLIVVEHLLTHGPERIAEEFQSDMDVILQMKTFQYVDEKGFNWGMNMRKKSERVMNFLEEGPLLKEERDRARKITRGIQGFGSFDSMTMSNHQEGFHGFGRSHSELVSKENFFTEQKKKVAIVKPKTEDSSSENFDPRCGDGTDRETKPLIAEKKMEFKTNENHYHPFVDDVAKNVALLSAADELKAY